MRGERNRRGTAIVVSAVLHGALVVGAWVAADAARPPTPMQVYRVDIVSPPPNLAGEPPAEAPAGTPAAESQPTPVPPASIPAAEPEPPRPVEPEPEPAPKPKPSEEPTPAPPKPKPAPPKPKAEEPRPTPPKPTPVKAAPEKKEPAKPAPEPAKPRTSEKKAAPEKPKAAESKPADRPQAAPGAAKAEGTKPVPATGREPVANSPGGEGLSVRTEGARCPSEQYCNNIVRQVKRYFRRPAEARADRGDVCFRVGRSGTVDDIVVERLRGSAVFKLALMEAVEQAAMRKEFGALPEQFGSDWLDVCVEVSPAN